MINKAQQALRNVRSMPQRPRGQIATASNEYEGLLWYQMSDRSSAITVIENAIRPIALGRQKLFVRRLSPITKRPKTYADLFCAGNG